MPMITEPPQAERLERVRWQCVAESKDGRVCERVFWLWWDNEFDSPADCQSLRCGRHSTGDESN